MAGSYHLLAAEGRGMGSVPRSFAASSLMSYRGHNVIYALPDGRASLAPKL